MAQSGADRGVTAEGTAYTAARENSQQAQQSTHQEPEHRAFSATGTDAVRNRQSNILRLQTH